MTEAHRPTPKRSNWVAITAGVIGGVLLLGAASTAAVAGVFAATSNSTAASQLLREDAAGISKIAVDSSAARFVMTCDQPETDNGAFVLSTSGGSREWRMNRQGDTLRVEPVSRWFGGFFSIGPIGANVQTVELTIPASACGEAGLLDADIEIGAGELQVLANFGALDLEVGAGDARIEGSVQDLDVDISAGDAELRVSDVRTMNLSVSAGTLTGVFAGSAPLKSDIEVSAGSADLVFPDRVYAVRSEVAAGEFNNGLRTDSSVTEREIDVEVSAGDLSLRAQG